MKLNIMHLIVRLPVGGMENMVYQEVINHGKNFSPVVCCIKEGGYFAEKLREKGYRVYVLNRMKRRSFDWKAPFEIAKILKQENIHILRSHAYHANLYGRIAGRIASVPVVVSTSHNVYGKPKIHRRIVNFILSHFCDCIVGVSNTVAKDIMRFDRVNADKVKVIYNGVDIERFNLTLTKKEARDIFNLPQNRILIGALGRLTEQKGMHYLIKAIQNLDVTLVIGGDGPLREKLEKLVNDLKTDCYFLGRVDTEKVPVFFKAIDIFCFPSLWEGFGLTLIEAMASGLPIVASKIESIKEWVKDNCIYFPPGDVKKLREALILIIKNQDLRRELGLKAKRMAELFSIENTVKSYEELYLKIYESKKRTI